MQLQQGLFHGRKETASEEDEGEYFEKRGLPRPLRWRSDLGTDTGISEVLMISKHFRKVRAVKRWPSHMVTDGYGQSSRNGLLNDVPEVKVCDATEADSST